MSWFYLKLPGGTLKVKPRSHLRKAEIDGEVPILDLGLFVLSWWSEHNLEREAARDEALGRWRWRS